jgi:polysaccharide biosynthesis transport protein
VAAAVEVESEGQADVVSIEATHENPAFAARLANLFAEQYIEFRREADRAKIRDAQELVRRRLAQLSLTEGESEQARVLRERADELDIIASLQTGNAELVQRADTPTSPSSPKTRRNVIIGAIFGLLLAAGMALLLDKLDKRVRDPKEIEEIFGRPILGVIPHSRALERTGPAREAPLPPIEEEAFWMLRANLLYFNVDESIRSVLVTSPSAGDGKSTVVWNLAAAAASTGSKVLIIEADLRNPVMSRSRAALPLGPGLSNLLSGRAEFTEVVSVVLPGQAQPAEETAKRGAARTMDVIVAGPRPPNPVDLLESDRMHQVIEEAGRDYDLVIVDTPPTAVVSDAIPLTKQVDGVIVVSRLGRSTRDGLRHLQRQLEHLRASVLGVVVNDAKRIGRRYGYGYDRRYLERGENGARDASKRSGFRIRKRERA